MTAYKVTIPAGAAPHYAPMTIETEARNEPDMRHMVWCMLGKRAAEAAIIVSSATDPTKT